MTTVSQERQRLAAVGMVLRRREQWGSRYDYTDPRTVDEPANRVFVHITVTNPDSYSSNDAHIRAVEAIGILRFPSIGVSYNRGVTPNGTLYELQPIGRRGAHTVNDFQRSICSTTGCPSRGESLTAPNRDWNLNYNARAYVICQNVGDPVGDRQLNSLARAIAADKLAGFVTRSAPIHGHRCVSSKICPGDKMWTRMSELKRLVSHYLQQGLQEEDVELTDKVGALTRPDNGQMANPTVAEALRSAAWLYYYVNANLASTRLLSTAYNARGHTVGLALETAKDGIEALRGAGALQADDEEKLAQAINAAAAAMLTQFRVVLREELAADIESGGVSDERLEAASERAVRRVLGGLDQT